jgi:thioredoxin 1
MSSFLTINEKSFPEQVLKSLAPVIVEFGAVWCAPCKRLEPIMEKLADEWGGKVRLVKIDVDESVNVAMNCQVMSVPTLILFIQGQEKQRLTGLQARERIIEKFTPYF